MFFFKCHAAYTKVDHILGHKANLRASLVVKAVVKAVVKESACQCRGHRFEPWSGRIPHAVERLSPCATTTEPEL